MIFNNTGSVTSNFDSEDISLEAQALIMEAAILDSCSSEEVVTLTESASDCNALIRDEIVQERSIVRLDKQAKISKAEKIAVCTIAKEKNDPLYKKLTLVWRMERMLEAKLQKKYGNEALRRAKKAVTNAKRTPATIMKKVTNNVTKQLNTFKFPGTGAPIKK